MKSKPNDPCRAFPGKNSKNVPQFHKIVKFEKLASKLTRETWKALQNSSGPIEMIDGSQMSLDSLKLEEEDVVDMLRSHRTKKRAHGLYVFCAQSNR